MRPRCKRRRAPDGSIEILFSAEVVDEVCPCDHNVADCIAPGPSEDGVTEFVHRGRVFGRRTGGESQTMTRPKRKSPGAGHRYVMVWPLDQWAELVAAAARENVSVAELIRRRTSR